MSVQATSTDEFQLWLLSECITDLFTEAETVCTAEPKASLKAEIKVLFEQHDISHPSCSCEQEDYGNFCCTMRWEEDISAKKIFTG